jgi:hypothetical protein
MKVIWPPTPLPWYSRHEWATSSETLHPGGGPPQMLALDRENKENLLILEDETVVAAWVQNPYWQYFCGMRDFQWAVPCDSSDQIYFPPAHWRGGGASHSQGHRAVPYLRLVETKLAPNS